MENDILPHRITKLDDLNNLPEEQILDIAYHMLRYCNHTVKATSESIKATLAKCDAMDKIAKLYSSFK